MTEQPRYRIAVLGGTGAQGSGLALRLANAGHTVTIGSRDAAKARECAAELSGRLDGKTIAGDGNRQAAEAAEIAILTVPYAVQQATVDDVRNEIAGKILIDATVPLVPPKVSVVQLPDGQSAVAAIQQRLGAADPRGVGVPERVGAAPRRSASRHRLRRAGLRRRHRRPAT